MDILEGDYINLEGLHWKEAQSVYEKLRALNKYKHRKFGNESCMVFIARCNYHVVFRDNWIHFLSKEDVYLLKPLRELNYKEVISGWKVTVAKRRQEASENEITYKPVPLPECVPLTGEDLESYCEMFTNIGE